MIPSSGQSQIRDYVAALVRRRWLMLLCVIATCLVAVIGASVTVPVYRATATVQIERQNPNILTFSELSGTDYSWNSYEDFYNTQHLIIASAAVAREVVLKLNLDSDPMFQPSESPTGAIAWLKSLLPRRARPDVPVDRIEYATKILQSTLEVTPVRNSQLVLISIVGNDPVRAAETANAVADAYIRFNMSSSSETTDVAQRFLGDQIVNLKEELLRDERRLQEYASEKHIVSNDDTNNITLQALQDISSKLALAKIEMAKAAAADSVVNDLDSAAMPEVLNSSLIAKLREEYAVYEAEYTEKSNRFKADWPELQDLSQKLEQASSRLELETNRIAAQVRASTGARLTKSKNEVDYLEALFAKQEANAQQHKSNIIEHTILRAEVEKIRDTLNQLVSRESEMRLAGSLTEESKSTNVRVIIPAKTPQDPFKPNITMSVFLGALLGLLLGVGLAQLLDYLDNSIKSTGDLEKITNLPIMAVISRAHGSTKRLARSKGKHALAPASSFDLIAHQAPKSESSEAYRELRTAILLSHAGRPPRQIMITSALPQEGKSATTVNLGIVFSQLGKRVLVIDTDLRRPRLHNALDVDNRRGVSTFLSGQENDLTKLIQPTAMNNFFLLPSGPISPNPSELLNSTEFEEMGKKLIELGFEHIIFDSPPLLSVSDSTIIAHHVDSSILVVRAGQTPRQTARVAAEKLEQCGSSAGLVLTDLRIDKLGASYYHNSPGYGSDEPDDQDSATLGADSPHKRAGDHGV